MFGESALRILSASSSDKYSFFCGAGVRAEMVRGIAAIVNTVDAQIAKMSVWFAWVLLRLWILRAAARLSREKLLHQFIIQLLELRADFGVMFFVVAAQTGEDFAQALQTFAD